MKAALHVLKNKKLEVYISTLGATLTRIITKDKNNNDTDILLGFDNLEKYQSPEYLSNYPYLGTIIGRYANRIAKGKFCIDGKIYQIAANNGENSLHGGEIGFDKRIWKVENIDKSSLVLTYVSCDGEENFPGNLKVKVIFNIIDNELHIKYNAKTDKSCYVNLTHHPYFNLNPRCKNINEHFLKLYTKKYLQTNNLIPTGNFSESHGVYDFTETQRIGNAIEQVDGLDDCYIFDDNKNLKKMAEVYCKETGIKLYVCSTYPGLQVYTGKYLDVKNVVGNRHCGAFSGLALEAQYFPDSPNHSNFPSTLLTPDMEYNETTIYGIE